MATAKTATLTFRIDPETKEALRQVAAQEHRSVANMVEVLFRDYCKQNGVDITTTHGSRGPAGEHKLDRPGIPGDFVP